MAFPGKIIQNSKTGQDIRFLQTSQSTDGQLLEMESTYQAHSSEPAPHYHPFQTEEFTVLVGELTVRLGTEPRVLKPGDVLHIPPNQVHSMWNNSGAPTVVNWKVRPALNTENLLETVNGLINDGQTNAQGMPKLLQVVLLARHFASVFRLASPPWGVPNVVFSLLAPLARLCGYRPFYDRYID